MACDASLMKCTLTTQTPYPEVFSKMNAWAFIQDNGWRKIQTLTPDGVTNMFTLLVDSQAWNRKVHIYADSSLIYQAYAG